MEQDLTESQTRFVKSLVETSDPDKDAEKHWEGGRAFRVFKQEFTDSKVTMMHLLMPTTSIDNEAYSQLIYAACLQVLRKAFQGTEFSLEHAAFAIFSLYALFESNPDPRGFNAPLELLTKRTQDELMMFESRNLMPVLRYIKYLVDTMRNNNIVWGVGRGSSLASFVLFLIGINKVNPLLHNLDIHEFLR